jgi:hypothetical protein
MPMSRSPRFASGRLLAWTADPVKKTLRDNAGEQWTDLCEGLPSRFGFPAGGAPA